MLDVLEELCKVEPGLGVAGGELDAAIGKFEEFGGDEAWSEEYGGADKK